MGEVYRARDSRLQRDVAVKVLPEAVAHDPGRLRRFEREARATAALSHPNVLSVFDVDSGSDTAYVVYELLEGTTLGSRLRKGPLPVREALSLASQAARGLAAAHARGIVHRDLKPDNLFLTTAGVLKILDFGLARLQPTDGEESRETTESNHTQPGTVLGTVSYMSPEQAKGLAVDERSDLFSLGVVLHEMLCGQHPFKRENSAETVSAILRDEPPALEDLDRKVPGAVGRLARRCLEKRPADRFQSASDLALVLDVLARGEDTGARPSSPTQVAAGRARRLLSPLPLALVVLGFLLGAAIAWRLWPAPPARAVVRSFLGVQPAGELNGGTPGFEPTTPGGSRTAMAWTPDGRALVFVGRRGDVQRLYVRRLDQGQAEPLPGTDGAVAPAVSPDGQWVAFWAQSSLRKVALSGGPVALVADGVADPPFGLAWGSGDRLYFGRHWDSIAQASAEGGTTAVTKLLATEVSHGLPVMLPEEKVLLFTARKRSWAWGDERIVAQVLATGERKVLLEGADARYLPSGHLVFLRQGVLYAVAFDPERVEVGGEPVALLDDVAQALVGGNTVEVSGAGQFSVAATGALAYLTGGPREYPNTEPQVVDRSGRARPLGVPPRPYTGPIRLSPDGRSLAFIVAEVLGRGIWVYDLERGTLTRLTRGGEDGNVSWSPDSQRIAFDGLKENGEPWLGLRPVDASAPTQWLLRDPGGLSSWAPSGDRIATVRGSSNWDIWIATLGGGEPGFEPFEQTDIPEAWPAFSPDGKWLAYGSYENGRPEVFVTPYPGPGPRRQVSVNGGFSPAWNPAGGELFFVAFRDGPDSPGRPLMVVDIRTSPGLRLGVPRVLFRFPDELGFSCIPVRCFDVSRDGQQFYASQVAKWPSQPPVTQLHLVQNWLEEVKARAGGE